MNTAWQPIESAPRNGRKLLLWREDCGVQMGKWMAPCDFLDESYAEKFSENNWFEPDWFICDYEGSYRMSNDWLPTHWMPLPEGPAEQTEADLKRA